jgi:surface antigen
VSIYIVAALGLNTFESAQRANVVEAYSAYLCSYTDPTRNSSGRSHTAVEWAMRPGISADVPSTADPAVISTNQQCIAGNKSKAVPEVYKVLSMSGTRAQPRRTAVHFAPLKQTVPIAKAAHNVTSFQSAGSVRSIAMTGSSNVFPFGQCTWWADQRYYQLHGLFVPWRTNAIAANWVNRAHEFGWHVSDTPIVGAIMVLQPGVQGAYSAGHVGVVEDLLEDGSVVASSMNWGSHPTMVTEHQFHPGPGVAFISQKD